MRVRISSFTDSFTAFSTAFSAFPSSAGNSASPFAILSVDAANYPAWLDLITYPVGSTTFESTYRKLAHYPGRQTLGVIKLNNQGAVWVVQSVNTGMMILIR